MHPKILTPLQPPPHRVSVSLTTIFRAFIIGSFIFSAQGSFIHDCHFVRRKEVAEEPKDPEGIQLAEGIKRIELLEGIEVLETTPASLCKNTGQIMTQEQCDQKSKDNTNMKITFAFSAVAFIGFVVLLVTMYRKDNAISNDSREMGWDDGEQPDEMGQGEVGMGVDGMEVMEVMKLWKKRVLRWVHSQSRLRIRERL
jgi:hypothetical protein